MGATGRIEINVGGTKFLTAASTLMSNSAYFSTLLNDTWLNSSSGEIFLDQDPIVFAKLLTYMREGIIKVEDIDIHVMILAEFLGMERLLLAIKVRWYCNIGKGPVDLESDEAIATAFDEVHGGIMKAISTGLYPAFLNQNELTAESDIAIMTVSRGSMNVVVNEIVNGTTTGPTIDCYGIIGALNGLHANGYTTCGDRLHRVFPYTHRHSLSFTRRRHSTIRTGDATNILIPTQDTINKRELVKEFAIYIEDETEHTAHIIAPGQAIYEDGVAKYVNTKACKHFQMSLSGGNPPYTMMHMKGNGGEKMFFWLEKNNFVTRESWILQSPSGQNWFQEDYIEFITRGLSKKCQVQLYSRPLLLSKGNY
jgi:hypothetical protein